MSILTEEIIHDLAELPTEMQMETLDFIRFLKTKWVNQHVLQTGAENNGVGLAELLDKVATSHLFADIADPVAWEREIRQDRPLFGREE